MTKLSVNINKVATLRNARGGNLPDVQRFAVDCELFGAQGITVHPRPDERHIRREDVYQLKSMVTTELNVEGNPTDDFLALVEDVHPTQVTLVPDEPGQLTSNHGWDTRRHLHFLKYRPACQACILIGTNIQEDGKRFRAFRPPAARKRGDMKGKIVR